MEATVHIDPGICGFSTSAQASSQDNQFVVFDIHSDCDKVQTLARRLAECGPVDAYQEISPVGQSVLLSAARETLSGCCAACAAPVGLFKAMQMAAGLALPKSIAINISRE